MEDTRGVIHSVNPCRAPSRASKSQALGNQAQTSALMGHTTYCGLDSKGEKPAVH